MAPCEHCDSTVKICSYCGKGMRPHGNSEGVSIDSKLGDCLGEAKEIITGKRQDSYGNPEDSFDVIAKYWETYINAELEKDHINITPKDVAHMMILLKVARCRCMKSNRDNYIDICGYASITADRLI